MTWHDKSAMMRAMTTTMLGAKSRLRYLSYACFAIAGALAFSFFIIALVGGESARPIYGTRMKFNTAVGLLSCAISLGLLIDAGRSSRRERIGHLFAILAFLMGCTTLFEYLSGMTLGIDELFVMDVRNQESSAFPGRMAPNAALSLCILGMALFLLDGKNWLNRFAQRLALLSGAIGVFALFGYLFDAHGLYQIFHFVRISPYSAATVVLLSIGVLAARPRYGIIKIILSREASGLFARRMLLAAFISPTLLAFSAEIAESRGYVDAPTALAVVALFTFLIFVMIVWQSAAAMSASETALTESELQFRMVANSIPQLAWMADSTGYITWYNQRWYDYTGTTLEQMRGWGWKAVHDAAHAARVMEKWRAHVESGESWEDTFPLKAADGSYRWFLSRADPLRNNEGVITHWFGTNTDITETLQSRDMAEKANLAKTQFLANMSHEIRTPIGAIIGFTEMLRSGTVTASERLDFTAIIERNSQHLLRLIDDILDLSKVESGKIALEKTNFDLPIFLTDLAAIFALRASEKSISFRMGVEGLIPSRITTDPLRLRQILLNLIGNAVKFTEHGSVEATVKYNSPFLQFTIVDTGPGISSENAGQLFQSFSQVDPSLTRKYGGSGLGLVLSKRLSQALAGDVVLEKSTVGVGTTFVAKIRLDSPTSMDATLFVGEEALRSASVAGILRKEGQGQLAGLNVLLVEDAADNRTLIANYLRKTGANVILAEDGVQGVDRALQILPDVVLMDIQMPKMDGHTAIRTLRNASFSRPIIALTAHAMREERDKCFESGATDYLTKPIRREHLIETLARYLPRDKAPIAPN